MSKLPLDPTVAEQAPEADDLTAYDREHLVTYLRLLDADAEGADWAEVARIVLHIDPSQHPERARRAWESHLARAKWMTQHGYEYALLMMGIFIAFMIGGGGRYSLDRKLGREF